MLSKKVDATLGAFWNIEGVQLQRQHKKPTIIRMDEAGVPTYQELVFVGNTDRLREKGTGNVMRRFLQAVARGAKAVKADPQLGADALAAADKDLDRATLLAQVKATLPVFFPENTTFPWGYMNADEWKAYGQWMLDNKLVGALPRATSITNEFLPGRGI
jgi:putative hydroxymethylpyrimidine transport system substrate-binding protein